MTWGKMIVFLRDPRSFSSMIPVTIQAEYGRNSDDAQNSKFLANHLGQFLFYSNAAVKMSQRRKRGKLTCVAMVTK